MDMDEQSRKMYEDIPEGGSLFTVDKIGLRIETKFLNKLNLKPWLKDNYITILLFGETTQINVHAEFEPWRNHLGKRCFDAILLLLNNGVFNIDFSILFSKVFLSMFPFICFSDSICILLLSYFFKIGEVEWAIDFLDTYPFSSINTDKNNPRSLKKDDRWETVYSKDYKETRRTVVIDGQEFSELKGVQKSFLIGYNKGSKIKSNRPIFRTEIKQHGKNKKDLSFEQLDGTAEESFNNVLPSLKKTLNKVIEPSALVLNDYWVENTPVQYKQLFLDKN